MQRLLVGLVIVLTGVSLFLGCTVINPSGGEKPPPKVVALPGCPEFLGNPIEGFPIWWQPEFNIASPEVVRGAFLKALDGQSGSLSSPLRSSLMGKSDGYVGQWYAAALWSLHEQRKPEEPGDFFERLIEDRGSWGKYPPLSDTIGAIVNKWDRCSPLYQMVADDLFGQRVWMVAAASLPTSRWTPPGQERSYSDQWARYANDKISNPQMTWPDYLWKRFATQDDRDRFDPIIAAWLAEDTRDAHVNLGKKYLERKQWGKASEELNKAIALGEDTWQVYGNLGIVLYESWKATEAVSAFTKAIERRPDFPDLYFNRGLAYGRGPLHGGDYDKAISDYTTVVKLDPREYAAYYNRALVYAEQRKRAEALADLEQVLAVSNDAQLLDAAKKEIARIRQELPVTSTPLPHPSATPTVSPSEAVRRFYALLDQRDFSGAYSLLSKEGAKRLPPYSEWVDGYRNTSKIVIQNLQPTDSRTVHVQLEAVDMVTGSALAKRYEGSWSLVWEDNSWKLDRASIQEVE